MNQTEQILREALREIQTAAEDCASGNYSWPHKQNYRDFAEHAKQALATEPAKLVRLTEEDVHRLAEEFGDKFEDSYIFNADGCFSVESFAHAIMDALEAKNGGK